MFFPTLALVEPGDEVIYPDPGFPTYEAMLLVAGGVPKPLPLLESKSFSFDLDAFDQLVSDKTRMIILNSPSNPTGGVIPLKDLQHIADAARRHDCWIVSDEIYNQIVFDGQTVTSIASLPGMAERTVIVDGFSKTYAMHGWRLGYGIMPEPLAERVRLFFTHGFGCTAQASQIAALEALTGPQDHVAMMVEQYQRRRNNRRRVEQVAWRSLLETSRSFLRIPQHPENWQIVSGDSQPIPRLWSSPSTRKRLRQVRRRLLASIVR